MRALISVCVNGSLLCSWVSGKPMQRSQCSLLDLWGLGEVSNQNKELPVSLGTKPGEITTASEVDFNLSLIQDISNCELIIGRLIYGVLV